MDPNDISSKRAMARIGVVLREKWRIDRLLGVGGMATVYAATHCNNGKRVAVKILHSELSVNPEVRTRFLREGYVANKVAHPAIVSVIDDDTADDGSVFLVMELLEGETVGDLLERSGHFLPVKQVVKIADQLLDVLAAAHQAGIVHRDIKPDNLFITQESTLKVLDFGIARLREISGAQLTLTGAGAMGTPAFMPPEQARGRSEQVGPRTDLWAVGATMYTMASGRLVHEAETVNELLLAAMTKPAQPFLQVLPMFPPPIAAVIDRALAFDQSARFPDARSMQVALRQAAGSIGIMLGDWSSISGINPIVSLAALSSPQGPPRAPPMQPPPMQPPQMQPPQMQAPLPMHQQIAPTQMSPPQMPPPRPPQPSAPEMRAPYPIANEMTPMPGSMQRVSPVPLSDSPTRVRPSLADAAMQQAAALAVPVPHHGHAIMATAPAVTVGSGQSSSSSKGLLIALAGLLVLVIGGVGVWAMLRSKPEVAPAAKPPPVMSATAAPTATAVSTATPAPTPSVDASAGGGGDGAHPAPWTTPQPTAAPTASDKKPALKPTATVPPKSSGTPLKRK